MNSHTPAVLLLALQTDIEQWATEHTALVSIASDPFEVYEILAEGPARVRVILHWVGDKDDSGEKFDLGIVRNAIEVIISHNRGLQIRPGDSLLRGTDTRPSLVALLSSLRSRVRSLILPEDDATTRSFEYRGTDPVVTPEGLRLDAYRLHFEIWGSLPDEPARDAVLPQIP